MRNIALRIEYDGTGFAGSQLQANRRTVQGEIERAWGQLTQEQRRIYLAGRTDAGVHARGQAANVWTNTHHTPATIQRGLTAILPEDIAIRDAWEVPPDFHARHTAISREYRFLIDNGRVAAPLLRHYALHVSRRLDIAAMDSALTVLLGTHDFAAFAGAGQEEPTVRTCYAASCQVHDLWGQPLIAIDIAANAFLRHMVRNIVGTLLLVGDNKRSVEDVAAILASRDRRKAGETVPAHGLYLMSVNYP